MEIHFLMDSELGDGQDQLFLGGGAVRRLGVDFSFRAGHFETDLQVTLQVGFANAGHDAVAVPGSADAVFGIGCDRHGAGDVLGQERSALRIVAGFDVLSKRQVVLVGFSHFEISHCFSLLHVLDDRAACNHVGN